MSDTNRAFSTFRRREFLKATAGAALLPAWFLEESRSSAQPPQPRDANDRPGIGLIGCGGMGRGDAKYARRFGKIVAVCDVDARHAGEASQMFGGARVHKDFRKLLEDKKIDVVARGARVIEETPGADGAPVAMGQRATDLEAVADHGTVRFQAFSCHGAMMRHAGER